MTKDIVHDDLDGSHGDLIDTCRKSQGKDHGQILHLGDQHGTVKIHFSQSCEIEDDQ